MLLVVIIAPSRFPLKKTCQKHGANLSLQFSVHDLESWANQATQFILMGECHHADQICTFKQLLSSTKKAFVEWIDMDGH